MFTILSDNQYLDPKIYGINTVDYSHDPTWHGENNLNYEFNKEIYNLIPKGSKVLELGCGGCGVVEQFVQDGYLAVGIDCQHSYRKKQIFAWKNISNNLFNVDLGKPFSILYNNESVQFDFIYSFECFEHIYTPDIEHLFNNINNHSKIGTIFYGSISKTSQPGHISIFDYDWWVKKFNNIGFVTHNTEIKNNIRNCADSIFINVKKDN